MARAGLRTSAGDESTGDQRIGGRRASPGGGWSGGGACQAVPSLAADALVMWGIAVMIAPDICDTQKAGTQFAPGNSHLRSRRYQPGSSCRHRSHDTAFRAERRHGLRKWRWTKPRSKAMPRATPRGENANQDAGTTGASFGPLASEHPTAARGRGSQAQDDVRMVVRSQHPHRVPIAKIPAASPGWLDSGPWSRLRILNALIREEAS